MPAPTKQNHHGRDPSESHPDDPQKTDFILNSDDSQFTNRTSSVFGSLASLEEKHVQHVRQSDFREECSMWKTDPDSDDRPHTSGSVRCALDPPLGKSSGPPFSGQNSMGRPSSSRQGFKRPHPASGRGRSRGRGTVPAYRAEPGKWRRYDLSSVSSSDMSDKTNSKAAFDFLSELKDRKEQEEPESMDSEDCEDSHHIVFKRPEKKSVPAAAAGSSTSDVASCSSGVSSSVFPSQGKIVLPEYVVGEKVKKHKPKPSLACTSDAHASCQAVAVGHIIDAEADTKEMPEDRSSKEMEKDIVFRSAKGKGRQHVRRRNIEEDD